MSKITTFAAVTALTLGITCLQTNIASARASHLFLTTSEMAGAVNGSTETITQTSSPTIIDSSTRTKPMIESFANAQDEVRGKPKYFIGINVKHH